MSAVSVNSETDFIFKFSSLLPVTKSLATCYLVSVCHRLKSRGLNSWFCPQFDFCCHILVYDLSKPTLICKYTHKQACSVRDHKVSLIREARSVRDPEVSLIR